jgi:hypothetical protein
VGEFASLSVPAWVKPGGHVMEYRQVAMEKATLSWEMMKALTTPYFANPPFLEGMEKLHNLFKGDISSHEGNVYWKPPNITPTHSDVIAILKDMIEEMTDETDPYPDASQIEDGRIRYRTFLENGRFPQFAQPGPMAPPEDKRKRPGKADVITPANVATLSSKRGVEALGTVEFGGSPLKVSRV